MRIKKQTLKFLKKEIKPSLVCTAPARINLINPLDAVEADRSQPSVAIGPCYAGAYIKKSAEPRARPRHPSLWAEEETIIKMYDKNLSLLACEKLSLNNLKEKKARLVHAGINRMGLEIPEFFEALKKKPCEIGTWTTIPRQSGLGGSTAIIIAALAGAASFYELEKIKKPKKWPYNKDTLAEIVTKTEDEDLGITAGYADRYVISRGGLAYITFHGKLLHKEIGGEPLATYDRIDETYNINSLPIVVAYSGIPHESGDVHRVLRKAYLSGDNLVLENYEKLATLAWQSRFALMKHDWVWLGELMRKNTEIMDDTMKHCGFRHGIGKPNQELVKMLEDEKDVLAAKLTGAGGGGSVFALTNPGAEERVKNLWEEKAKEKFQNSTVFRIKMEKKGHIISRL